MNKAKLIGFLVPAVILLVAAWGLWMWFFCRFYVAPNQMAVVISKHGDALQPGQILAHDGQQGIQETVLGEGRHFLNPFLYAHELHPMLIITPGKVGIVTSKVGADLPEGEFLADEKQKGIWRKVLGPGKYRLNPYGYKVDIVDAISIPIGYCGVITSLSGKQAPAGEFAAEDQKGVRQQILQPGLYYVNPKAFKIDVLEVGVNQVSLLGKSGGKVVTKGQIQTHNKAMESLQNSLMEQKKQSRLDYISQTLNAPLASIDSMSSNSKLGFRISSRKQKDAEPAESKPQPSTQRIGMVSDDSMSMVLSQFVEFPSRDGFQISLDMTVEIELLPKDLAWIFSRYGDLPALVDKVIMPQITSVSRNKGSEYQAKDFIMGEGREKFQTELTKSLAAVLGSKNIVVHNAIIRHVEVPDQILEPIQQASIAIQQNLTNMEKQNTAKKLAMLNTELSLISQKSEQVAQETTKLKAEIRADQDKQVAMIKAGAIKKSAEIAKQTAEVEADTVRIMGQAQADAKKLVEGEKAKGLQMVTAAFGNPVAFSLMKFADMLNRDAKINIIHAGEGTLWTDLKNASTGELGGAILLKEKDDKPSGQKRINAPQSK